MNSEYQAAKSKGKLLFKSKITGLDYAIPENSKKSSAPSGNQVGTKSNSRNAEKYNDLFKTINTGKLDFTKPKSVKPYTPPTKSVVDSKTLDEYANSYNEAHKNSPSTIREMEDARKAPLKEKESVRATYQGDFEEREYYARKDKFNKNSKMSYGNMAANALDPTGIIRKIAPESVKGITEKVLFNTHTRDDKTFGQQEKAVMYKAGEIAQKRTGSLNAGVTYDDILKVPGLKSDEKDAIRLLVDGKVNPAEGAVNSSTSAAYNVASSLGQWSVAGKKDGSQFSTDLYEFTNSMTKDPVTGITGEKYMSTGDTWEEKAETYKKNPLKASYRELRRYLAKKDDTATDEQLNKMRSGVNLSPADTLGFSQEAGRQKIVWK